MAKKLLIVESPAKERTLAKFLGKNFTIASSYGHVRDLPTSTLGVNVEKGFQPRYKIIDERKKIVARLKKLTKNADEVYLASDPDREGEAIAWHVAQVALLPEAKTFRVTFNELTKSAVLRAIEHPGKIDMNKVNAQQARRVLDRLVGYMISPLLWEKVARGLSAGRVQSVALKLIVHREREIAAFVPQEYWEIAAKLALPTGEAFEAMLYRIAGEEPHIESATKAREIVASLMTKEFRVTQFEKQEMKKKPLPPFNTSHLQQAASIRLRFSASRTMAVAQQLYEGVELGDEGHVALITYMRTDSFRVAREALDACRGFVNERFGPEYLSREARVYKSRKTAQEAHEAIRPVDVTRTPDQLRGLLSEDQFKLYDLIWRRFVATQMRSMLYEQQTAEVTAGDAVFRATGRKLLFPGFTVLDERKEEMLPLPELSTGTTLRLLDLVPSQHFTKAPPRYTEASLVKTLEKEGIGRPSTYASIISTIQERGYVRLENRAFYATELGMLVSDLLEKHFSRIMDVRFTSHMEELLDEIEEQKADYEGTLKEFYTPFEEELSKARAEMKSVKGVATPSPYNCPSCGKTLLVRMSRHGKFLGCSGYPECKEVLRLTKEGSLALLETTCAKCGKPLLRARLKGIICSDYGHCDYVQPKPEYKDSGEICPKCSGPMVRRKGRGGDYLACANYPKCRTTKALPTNIPCPVEGCTGTLICRRGKGRQIFYGCTRYPDCTYTTPKLPDTTPDTQPPAPAKSDPAAN